MKFNIFFVITIDTYFIRPGVVLITIFKITIISRSIRYSFKRHFGFKSNDYDGSTKITKMFHSKALRLKYYIDSARKRAAQFSLRNILNVQ